MLTRYAEERAAGESVEQSLLTTISQGGRVVVVSGVVLAIAWGSVVWLPPPFDTFGNGTTTMVLVTVLAQLTLVPSILGVLPGLGPPAAEKRTMSCGRGSQAQALGTSRTEMKRLVGARGRPPTRDTPMAKAEMHRQGIVFRVGKRLIAFPVNLLVFVLVYGLMMPLTLRMSKNFSILEFKFKMGHGYELGIPRDREEWNTALQIQKDFPTSVGIMMPMLIIGTGPGGPPSTAAAGSPASVAAAGGPIDVQDGPLEQRALPATDIDVEGDEFFEANCRMVDSLIRATRNMSYALTVDSFVSATFHEESAEGGGVECLSPSLIKAIRTNYVSKNMLLTHTSENLQRLWDQLVSKDGNAMLTFAFPDLDPFSPGAFSLVNRVREALRNETRAARRGGAALPGLTFTVFSPSSVIMDLIDVTSQRLPVTFAGCIVVSLLLIAMCFGSVLLPLKLFMTVVIPITWTYGAALYVYEDGALAWLGMPCLAPLGDAGLDWSVPVMTLTFIVGLAFDYEIFLIERVREFRQQGFSDQESILLGLAATSETITAAGLIMTFTFIAELLSTIPVSNQMGFVLVYSIVVDTFVVRSVLDEIGALLCPVMPLPEARSGSTPGWVGAAMASLTESNETKDLCGAQWLLLWTTAAYAPELPGKEDREALEVFYGKFQDICREGSHANCLRDALRERGGPPPCASRLRARWARSYMCDLDSDCMGPAEDKPARSRQRYHIAAIRAGKHPKTGKKLV
ncbi:unnamed protein product [Prorocentrum cordatum]|uniref:Membrane transport protein MMPL domain-containing protein n=1 Tax=Prorocentrum cordatum TaxID=2364126 RepID=A0ABN9Y293_9DINO|nr:unnamed protein product [Polarella glacialis]